MAGPKRPYTTRTLGRSIRRIVSCFQDLNGTVVEANRRFAEPQGKRRIPAIEEDIEDLWSRDRTFEAYHLLVKVAPKVKDLLNSSDDSKLRHYLNELQLGANSARTDDTARINRKLAEWINNAFNPNERLAATTRSNRGLGHDICGKLLTPIELDWDDHEVRGAIQNGTSESTMNDSYFLRCLYLDDAGDPENLEEGFLRSRWLLLTFHAIFISPSVEEEEYRGSEDLPRRKQRPSGKGVKANVSTIVHLNGTVTGRAIAYTAVILVFNLTDASSWRDNHNGFSFEGFYNFLVDYFEKPTDPESKAKVNALLTWWRCQVFPRQTPKSDPRASYKKLAAQRSRLQDLTQTT